MNGHAEQILQKLQNAPELLSRKKIAAGFDGFIDSIVKVVHHKAESGATVYFDNIAGFGNYITGKSGSGFSLESEELVQKLGGNMPILANAMAQMGSMVDCIGALGIPGIAPVFNGMHANCNLHTYTNPGFTTAMEFADGKIMLAQMTDLNRSNWDTIKAAIGLDKLQEIFLNANLVCLVNWSELDHSNNIWEGLLADVFTASQPADKTFFFDLSDCSKRKPEAIKQAIDLIQQFRVHGHATLSLNRNEANILREVFIGEAAGNDLKVTGGELFNALNIDTIIIHSPKVSILWKDTGIYESKPEFIVDPKFSTGAGDNFNAGFCIATLLDLLPVQSLVMANSVANQYITNGESPDLEMLKAYLAGLTTTEKTE